MHIAPILDRASIVLLGNFNPAIFTPAWFALNDLVSREDAERAIIQVVHPELCQFEVGQFNIQADKQRFSVSCPMSHREMARDLIVGTFGNILRHTPVRGVGLNREVHFDTGNFKVRNAVGDHLAPKKAWGKWADALSNADLEPIHSSGLASLAMQETFHGEFSGHIQATIQPSLLPQLNQQGIFMLVNCHYNLADEAGKGIDLLLAMIEQRWDFAFTHAEMIIDDIQSIVLTYQKN